MEPIFPANPTERVGFYGGRIAHGFLGEPLNLASDILFVIIIAIVFFTLRKDGFSDKPVLALILLGGLVGLGSVIFHGHPNKVTLQIDLIPVTVFGLSFIAFSMRRFFNFSYTISILITGAFLLFSKVFVEIVVHVFRVPGLHHIPSILVLILIGTLLFKSQQYNKVARAFIIAAGCYLAAMFFRYLDFFVYRSFPLGTHFLWHAFTSCVIGILLYTAVTYGRLEHKYSKKYK